MSDDTRRGFTRDTLRDKVFELMCANTRVVREDLAEDRRLKEDLGLDSLDFLSMVNEVEHELDISIPDDQAYKLRTLAEVLDAIWALLAEPPKGPKAKAAGGG